jgi:hypothetical protein
VKRQRSFSSMVQNMFVFMLYFLQLKSFVMLDFLMLKSQRQNIFCTTEEDEITEKSKRHNVSRILNHLFSVKRSSWRPTFLVTCGANAFIY